MPDEKPATAAADQKTKLTLPNVTRTDGVVTAKDIEKHIEAVEDRLWSREQGKSYWKDPTLALKAVFFWVRILAIRLSEVSDRLASLEAFKIDVEQKSAEAEAQLTAMMANGGMPGMLPPSGLPSAGNAPPPPATGTPPSGLPPAGNAPPPATGTPPAGDPPPPPPQGEGVVSIDSKKKKDEKAEKKGGAA